MTQVRIPTKNSKYYVDKHTFSIVLHYCYKYADWKREYSEISDALKSATNDGQPSGSGNGDSTAVLGIRAADLSERVAVIERTAKEIAPDIYDWLIRGVTVEGMTYNQLNILGIPCGHNYYYQKRREFYFTMSRRIKMA